MTVRGGGGEEGHHPCEHAWGVHLSGCGYVCESEGGGGGRDRSNLSIATENSRRTFMRGTTNGAVTRMELMTALTARTHCSSTSATAVHAHMLPWVSYGHPHGATQQADAHEKPAHDPSALARRRQRVVCLYGYPACLAHAQALSLPRATPYHHSTRANGAVTHVAGPKGHPLHSPPALSLSLSLSLSRARTHLAARPAPAPPPPPPRACGSAR